MKACPDCESTSAWRTCLVNDKDKTEEHHIICKNCCNSVKAETAAAAEQKWEDLKKDPIRHAVGLGKAACVHERKLIAIDDENLTHLIAENEELKQRLISAWHCGYDTATDKAEAEKRWNAIQKEGKL